MNKFQRKYCSTNKRYGSRQTKIKPVKSHDIITIIVRHSKVPRKYNAHTIIRFSLK